MKISSVLTLGLLPLWRMMSGGTLEDPRLTFAVYYSFEHWGAPPKEKIEKAFTRTLSPEKAKLNYERFLGGDTLLLSSEKEAEKIVAALEKSGIEFHFTEVGEGFAWIYSQKWGWVAVEKYNYCNSCGDKPARLRHRGHLVVCSRCDSDDVIFAKSLPVKEFIKHVDNFDSLPSRGKASSRAWEGGNTVTYSSLDDFDD
jgi:hypothetical protein